MSDDKQDDYRRCDYCGCNTNRKRRACCQAGSDVDKLQSKLAAANEANERLMEAFETVTGTRETLHAANVAGAIQDIADERDTLRAEVERLREDEERVRIAFFEFYHDWKNGDFQLPELAACDVRNVVATYAAIDAARVRQARAA